VSARDLFGFSKSQTDVSKFSAIASLSHTQTPSAGTVNLKQIGRVWQLSVLCACQRLFSFSFLYLFIYFYFFLIPLKGNA